jgi:hypothetical protein
MLIKLYIKIKKNIKKNYKVLHFLNQLIGSLNVEVLEDKLMLATLLDYVEYHKSLKDEKAKQR